MEYRSTVSCGNDDFPNQHLRQKFLIPCYRKCPGQNVFMQRGPHEVNALEVYTDAWSLTAYYWNSNRISDKTTTDIDKKQLTHSSKKLYSIWMNKIPHNQLNLDCGGTGAQRWKYRTCSWHDHFTSPVPNHTQQHTPDTTLKKHFQTLQIKPSQMTPMTTFTFHLSGS